MKKLKEILAGGKSKKATLYDVGDMIQADDGNTYIVVDTAPYEFENLRKRVNDNRRDFKSFFIGFFWVLANAGHSAKKEWEVVGNAEPTDESYISAREKKQAFCPKKPKL